MRSERVEGVGHDELLRGLGLLSAKEIRQLLADIQVPEGRLPVKVVVDVQALRSTWSGVEALGHDAAFSRGGASLGAGLAEAGEEILCFVGFEHCNWKSFNCQY